MFHLASSTAPRLVVATLALSAGLALSACGSDDDGGGSATAASAGAEVKSGPAYSGPEKGLPRSYGIPVKKPGKQLTFGYLNATSGNELTNAVGEGLAAEAKFLGAKTIVLDNQLKVDKEISNFQQLLAQGVDGILVNPLDPKALSAVMAQAKAKGVPVIGVDISRDDASLPDTYVSQIMKGADHQAYDTVKAIAAASPGAQLGLVNIAVPVAGPRYQMERTRYWAPQFGLRVAGEQNNATDDAAGGEKAATPLLNKYPDLEAIAAYNDPSALGASTAARGLGRKIKAAGSNGGSDGIGGVKSGQLLMTTSVDAVRIGAMAAAGLYNVQTKQHLPLPKSLLVGAQVVTKENVASFTSADEKARKIAQSGLTEAP